MRKMRLLTLLLYIVVITASCSKKEDSLEESRRDLYVNVMKSVYELENGGNDFIALKLSSLEGLSDKDKEKILEEFKEFSPNVYDFEKVKNDKDKFVLEGDEPIGTKNGTVLWIDLTEYKENSAKIMGTSWFGNLGSVSIEYDATLENGNWNLNEISMRQS